MKSIILRSLHDKKFQLLIIIGSAIGFLEMYIALFPALQKQASQMAKLLKDYPDSFLKAFNIDKSGLTFEKLGQYLAMEQFNFVWPILAIVLAIGFANYAFAGEKERGTIELLLSQPISRIKLFVSRYTAGLISILVFGLFSILVIIPLAKLHGISVQTNGVFMLLVISFLFAWAIYGIAFLVSVIFSEKSKATFAVGGILILSYVLNIVANLKDSLHLLKYFSVFYYYNPSMAIDKAQIINGSWLVFLGIIIVTFCAGLFWFNKQDIANT
jgi:ABC-2 type transport system permease protein